MIFSIIEELLNDLYSSIYLFVNELLHE